MPCEDDLLADYRQPHVLWCLFVCLSCKARKGLSGRIRSTSLNKHLIKNQLRRSGIKIKGKCHNKATFPLCLPMPGEWRWLFFHILAPPPPPTRLLPQSPTLSLHLPLSLSSSDGDSGGDLLNLPQLGLISTVLWIVQTLGSDLGACSTHHIHPRPPLINIAMETKWQEIDFFSSYIGVNCSGVQFKPTLCQRSLEKVQKHNRCCCFNVIFFPCFSMKLSRYFLKVSCLFKLTQI